jgi:hypothetical protein
MDREYTQIREIPPATLQPNGVNEGRKGEEVAQGEDAIASLALHSSVVEPGREPAVDWDTVGGGKVERIEIAIGCALEAPHGTPASMVLGFAVPTMIWLGMFFVTRKFTLRSLFVLTFCYAIVMAIFGLR